MSEQTIKLKRSNQSDSSGIPTTSQLELGEVAINTYHGNMYIKKSDEATPTPNESIVQINEDTRPVVDDFFADDYQALTTTLQVVGFNSSYTATDYGEDRAVTLDINLENTYNDGASGYAVTNDVEYYVEVRRAGGSQTIPKHTFEATHVLFGTFGGVPMHKIRFDGDVRPYMGNLTTGMYTSATPPSSYAIKYPKSYYYENGYTYLTYATNFGSMFSSGTQDVCFSLNNFASAGTWTNIKTIHVDQVGDNYVANLNRDESFKVKVGVTDVALEYRLRAREVSTNGDSCVHNSHLFRVIGDKV
jgi:hypothetical protein